MLAQRPQKRKNAPCCNQSRLGAVPRGNASLRFKANTTFRRRFNRPTCHRLEWPPLQTAFQRLRSPVGEDSKLVAAVH